MYGAVAVAATEVVYYYYASKSLTGMRCITNTDIRPQGDVELYNPVAVCCCCDYWRIDKRPRVAR